MGEDSNPGSPGAIGHFVVFLANLLARSGVIEVAEFAALLGAFAATVEETDPEEGASLAEWSCAVHASVEDRRTV